MKKAYLVLNQQPKKLVKAEDVDHADYGKIFQCPECSATVTLRAGYYRGDVWVAPAFVHPENSPSNCRLRIDFYIRPKREDEIFSLLKRGQSSQRLEKALMLFLKSCLRRKLLPLSCIIYPEIIEFPMGSDKELERYIQYNKFTDPVHRRF